MARSRFARRAELLASRAEEAGGAFLDHLAVHVDDVAGRGVVFPRRERLFDGEDLDVARAYPARGAAADPPRDRASERRNEEKEPDHVAEHARHDQERAPEEDEEPVDEPLFGDVAVGGRVEPASKYGEPLRASDERADRRRRGEEPDRRERSDRRAEPEEDPELGDDPPGEESEDERGATHERSIAPRRGSWPAVRAPATRAVMAVIVQKYGGSSVADIEKLGRVADKVVAAKRAGSDVVVIVSAMGKATDELLALARKAAGAAGEPPRRELDMLVSTGERVSMALLAIAIAARGEQAISFTGSQSGIITNDRHFDARIIEIRPHRIEDELARGRVVIVAGYQGMSYRREITTLGRGGSDTTAVALAAALSAERCEIYSDVDGVYSADPRVVPDAKHLPELDPTALQEMAECGAKVLNAQAVEWAKNAKIAIYARSTGDPWERGDGGKQTIVRAREGNAVRAIVGEQNLVLLRLTDGGLGALDLLAACAAEHEIPIKDVSASGAGVKLVVPLLNVPDWARARAALVRAGGAALTIREGLAAVSVVGDGLSTTGKPLVTMLNALREANVVVHDVTASALRMTALIDPETLPQAQRALHAKLA